MSDSLYFKFSLWLEIGLYISYGNIWQFSHILWHVWIIPDLLLDSFSRWLCFFIVKWIFLVLSFYWYNLVLQELLFLMVLANLMVLVNLMALANLIYVYTLSEKWYASIKYLIPKTSLLYKKVRTRKCKSLNDLKMWYHCEAKKKSYTS